MDNLKSKIEYLFKEVLQKISDDSLKTKVVDIWVYLLKKGGWQLSDIEKIPFTLLTDSKGVSLIEHTIAVTESAFAIASTMKKIYKDMFDINFDWLIAGGLLHDVGKLLEIEQKDIRYQKSYIGKCLRHPILGAVELSKFDLPPEIINIVACHSKEGEGAPKRIETILIYYADLANFEPFMMMDKNMLI